ncbi:MAG: MerR family transcriptional regulator [Nannocystaceae bacterium]|nr:MerR family transcriptional regulator [Nannocystaceae bacterium]
MVDQRGIDDQRSLLDARTAAARLGVDVRTLYAYAARGLVRSRPGPHGRRHLYDPDDIDRLLVRKRARAGHGAVAAAALRFGEPVLDSAITALGEGDIRYRGHALSRLVADGVGFERVAELLWSGALPARVQPWTALPLPWSRLRAVLQAPGAAIPRLAWVASWIGLAHGAALEDDAIAGARALVATLAMALAWPPVPSRGRGSTPTVAERCAWALGCAEHPRKRAAIELALVVSADHELNASAFGVRVAASTGADLAASVAAGLHVMSGPRHGAASRLLEQLLERAGAPSRVPALVRERLRLGERIPGFGHPIYPAGDPRVPPLLACARAMAPRSQRWLTLESLLRAMAERGRDAPNLDAGLVAITIACGLPPGTATGLFALGRTAGWIAHALEQRAAGFILRPRARYVGP